MPLLFLGRGPVLICPSDLWQGLSPFRWTIEQLLGLMEVRGGGVCRHVRVSRLRSHGSGKRRS